MTVVKGDARDGHYSRVSMSMAQGVQGMTMVQGAATVSMSQEHVSGGHG